MTINFEHSCKGKRKIGTKGAAKEAARKYRVKHGRGHMIRGYKCPYCGLYHIGHYA